MQPNTIILKPLSQKVLLALNSLEQESIKSEDLAAQLEEKVRAVDAAVTKSLVRYGFVVREYEITRMMKRSYAVLKITPRGREYAASLLQ